MSVPEVLLAREGGVRGCPRWKLHLWSPEEKINVRLYPHPLSHRAHILSFHEL